MTEYIPPSLQDQVVDDLPTILSLLDDYYAEHSSPLIDYGFDESDERSWHYLRVLQHMLELDESSAALEVMYNSFHFALNLAGLANWQHRDAPGFYGQYCQNLAQRHGDDKEALAEQILTDTQAYMAKNGTLARVVAAYSEHVTSEPSLTSLSSTVAALTLMQIDQDMTVRSGEGDVQRLMAQLDAWDGDIAQWGDA